jgi:hypothetical protein
LRLVINQSNISSAERLYNLQWLPVHLCINFKLALVTYKTITLHQPSYLYSLPSPHSTRLSLCFSNQNLLINLESAQSPARALLAHLRLKYGIFTFTYTRLFFHPLFQTSTLNSFFSVYHSPSVPAAAVPLIQLIVDYVRVKNAFFFHIWGCVTGLLSVFLPVTVSN